MTIGTAIRRSSNPFRTFFHRNEWQSIEARRAQLLSSPETFQDIDYGAGDPKSLRSADQQQAGVVEASARVSDFAGYSKPPFQCRTIYHLTRLRCPKTVLELGTCVGISGAYISAALKKNGNGHLWSIEGSPHVAAIATTTLAGLGFSNEATVICGPFHKMLGPIINDKTFDLVFIDGHHDGAATVRYFAQIKPKLNANAVVIFDDINWSADMASAWAKIAADGSVKQSATSGGMGIVAV